jgi:ribonuclease HI
LSTIQRELKDPATARKIARAFEALEHGQSVDRAAAYAAIDRRVLVRVLGALRSWAGQIALAEQKVARPRKRSKKTKRLKLIAFSDGASRGNPGKAACAVILFDEKNEELLRRSKPLGVTTNNVAEYEGVVLALDLARTLGASDVEVRLDSELVVRQLNGQYKVKHPTLKPLFERARGMMAEFDSVAISHVPRDENTLADELANDELDGKGQDP